MERSSPRAAVLVASALVAAAPWGAWAAETSGSLGSSALDAVAAEVAATLGRTVEPPVPLSPDGLDDGPGEVYAALRSAGLRLGSAWGSGATRREALVAAVTAAGAELTPERRAEVDAVELAFARDFRALPPGDESTVLVNVERGVLGLEVRAGLAVRRLSPTEAVASNRSFDRWMEHLAQELGLATPERLRELAILRVFAADQVLVSFGAETRGRAMVRGNELVPLEAVTRSAVVRLAAGLADWMVANVHPDGRMTYAYWPSRGAESEGNNAIRQWMASLSLVRIAARRGEPELVGLAARNLRYNLETFYRQDGDLGLVAYAGKVKLGAVALAALALGAHPDRAAFDQPRNALERTVRHLAREDGSFQTFYEPADRGGLENFYPGEALLLWATRFRETRDEALLERIMTSIEYYRRWHLAHRNPAFVPWHTKAATLVWETTRDPGLAAWIFEMNDWLLGVQERTPRAAADTAGRFYDPARPFGPPHASSTGVYLEGLVAAWTVAEALGLELRAESYRRAIVWGLRSLMQLQFADDVDLFYVQRRDAARGGLRTTVYDNEIRVDNVQHAWMAVDALLERWDEADFRPGDEPE